MRIALLVAGGISLALAAGAFWQLQRIWRAHVWTPASQSLNLKERGKHQVSFVADGTDHHHIAIALQRTPYAQRAREGEQTLYRWFERENAVLELLESCVQVAVFCEGVALETGEWLGYGWSMGEITRYVTGFPATQGKCYTVQLTVTKPIDDLLAQKAFLKVQYSHLAFKAACALSSLWLYMAIFFVLISLPLLVLGRRP